LKLSFEDQLFICEEKSKYGQFTRVIP